MATNSINIAWTFPPVEMKNHVHYFKLLMLHDQVREETVVHTDSDFSYAFTDLKSATTYDFQVSDGCESGRLACHRAKMTVNVVLQVAGCNEYTNECGNYSKTVSGVTLDGGKVERIENEYNKCDGRFIIVFASISSIRTAGKRDRNVQIR